MGWNELMQGT